MARISSPVCRLCRRAGQKLFLKGTRCDTPKCAVERREAPPGMASSRRSKPTDYGIHLREKQKVKQWYGLLERQFRRYFHEAARGKGNTGEALLVLLERRLDNIVYRLGFGLSRSQARMMITHGHVTVNGRRADIASMLLRAGDVIRIKNRPKSVEMVKANMEMANREVPDFLSRVDGPELEGHLVRLPDAHDASAPVQTNLIVELLSK
jgi:small subunit ribosomal protein S4